jgi:hypothetical protein
MTSMPHIESDDEIYRVNAIWLGPPKFSMPFRARYVAWGIGILTFLLTFSAVRAVGFGLSFFTVAWTLVITVVITRAVGRLINAERPFGAVLTMFSHEVAGPRRRTRSRRGVVGPGSVRITQRPRHQPVSPRRQRSHHA